MDVLDKTSTASLKLLGDFWTLRIISALGEQDVRFCDLQRSIGNCNPVTLTDRLKKLEEAKLVNRIVEPDEKQCVTYSLTERGKEALPIIAAIDSFTEKTRGTTL